MIKSLINMITSEKDYPALFSVMRKAFTYQGGALIIMAAAPSYTVKQFFELLLRDVDMRDIMIPLIVFTVLLGVYIVVSSFDFYTGISASKKKHIDDFGHANGYIKADKLWSSIWKFSGVLLITSVITIFTLIFAILDKNILYGMFMYGLVVFFLIVCLWDMHSIGENQFRRYGEKPKFYTLVEDAAEIIKNGFIKKIAKIFE